MTVADPKAELRKRNYRLVVVLALIAAAFYIGIMVATALNG
jgi:hypothetical protein